jgi:Zn finger protein HypA/HybF involved in hydrogenase expression
MTTAHYDNHLNLIDGLIEALQLSGLPYPVECENCNSKGEVLLTREEGEWDYTDFRISQMATYGPCPKCKGKGYQLMKDEANNEH